MKRIIEHKTLSNLLMAIILLFGFLSLNQLNVQFWPDVNPSFLLIETHYENASPKQVDQDISIPLENVLSKIEGVEKTHTYSERGLSKVFLEINKKTSIEKLSNQVNNKLSTIVLPKNSEKPIVIIEENKDLVAKVLISFDDFSQIDINKIQKYKTELLNMGISSVSISGFNERDIVINIKKRFLLESKLSIQELSNLLNKNYVSSSLGKIGNKDLSRTLKINNTFNNIEEIKNLELLINNKLYKISDIADINYEQSEFSSLIYHNKKPSIELLIERKFGDSIEYQGQIFETWKEKTLNNIPEYMDIIIIEEYYKDIKKRIDLFYENSIIGFLLVLFLLFLLLDWRLAIWVAMGIPVSFAATFILLDFFDYSINILTLFALIMSIGIIVDDAIIISEQTLKEIENGVDKKEACYQGVKKMILPIIASGLTTIAAFIPLFNIEGQMGEYIKIIPVVVTAVISASLIEAIFILPAHIYMSSKNLKTLKINNFLNNKLISLFDRSILFSIKNKKTTILFYFLLLISSAGLMISGLLNFEFFPTVKKNSLYIIVEYQSNVTKSDKDKFISHIEDTYLNLKKDYPDKVTYINRYTNVNMEYDDTSYGNEYVSFKMNYITDDKTPNSTISDNDFIELYKNNIQVPNYVKRLSLKNESEQFNQKDIEFLISSENYGELNLALSQIKEEVSQIEGVEYVEFGENSKVESWSIELKEYAKNIGVSNYLIAEQLYSMISGSYIINYNEGEFNNRVLTKIEQKYRDDLMRLDDLPIKFNDKFYRLDDLVIINKDTEYMIINRVNKLISIPVIITLRENYKDNKIEIFNKIENNIIPKVLQENYVHYELYGETFEQDKTLYSTIKYGVLGLLLIYLILSIMFNSYKTPLLIMSIIPFSLCGVLFGHFILNYNLNILSVFSIFGLSGLVVNSSIILVTLYKENLNKYNDQFTAIYISVKDRIRSLFLTTITTIIGLLPILLNKQSESDFLIPMAISMIFGSLVSFFIVIHLLPAFISIGCKTYELKLENDNNLDNNIKEDILNDNKENDINVLNDENINNENIIPIESKEKIEYNNVVNLKEHLLKIALFCKNNNLITELQYQKINNLNENDSKNINILIKALTKKIKDFKQKAA